MTTETERQNSRPESVKTLIEKLRKGQEWLATQHDYWSKEYTVAVDDETFYNQLYAWEEHDRTLRQSGFEGCIWEPLGRCPAKSVVKCQGCIQKQPGLW